MHYPLAPQGQFKYTTPQNLVVVLDRENVYSHEKFEHRDLFLSTSQENILVLNLINFLSEL
jgi:hypothetical protein